MFIQSHIISCQTHSMQIHSSISFAFDVFQVGTQFQPKLTINEQPTASISNLLLNGFDDSLNANNFDASRNFGSALSRSSNDPMISTPGVNNSSFSSFAGLHSDHLQITRPRMRICFDPETEIPRLQKWFAENNHPTRQQVK